MAKRRTTPEKLYAEMYEFAMRNRQFAKREVHSISVEMAEEIGYQEVALSALLKQFGVDSLNELGETLADEQGALHLKHFFKAQRLVDTQLGKEVVLLEGAAVATHRNIRLPSYLTREYECDEEDDLEEGSLIIGSHYTVSKDHDLDEVDVEVEHSTIFNDEDDEFVRAVVSQEIASEDPMYVRMSIGGIDDDSEYAQEQGNRQFVDGPVRERLAHEPLDLRTAEELAEVQLLPGSLHDYEVGTYLQHQDVKIAAYSFRSLRRLIREQAGVK